MCMSALPVELLQIIFRTVRDDLLEADEEDMSWMPLARVSRYWRDVLRGDPFMWTHLAFPDKAPFHVVEAALARTQQVGGVHLKFTALSFGHPSGCGWLMHLSMGWPLSTYTLPGTVRFLSFRWREGVRDTVFEALEGLRADGVVSLVLEEFDPEDDDGVFSESSWDSGSVVSGDDMVVESADDEASDGDGGEESSDNGDVEANFDSDKDMAAEDADSGLDGHWDGPEFDDAGYEDESSDVSIPGIAFGLGNDSSTYFDSESDGGKHLSEPEDQEGGAATGTESGDDHNADHEDVDEDMEDIVEMSLQAANPAQGGDDVNAVEPVGPAEPRILQLPEFPSLINLAASSVLLSIPLQVKEQLTDMTLMNSSYLGLEYQAAERTQSWVLDVLEGCVQLMHLHLCYNLSATDWEARTVVLPKLKFLQVDDVVGGVSDILEFVRPDPEELTRLVLRSLLYREFWEPADDGVFIGNLPEDFALPHAADTVALNLQVDNGLVLRGQTSTPFQWDLWAMPESEHWPKSARKLLLQHAVLELWDPRLVVATSITTLAIHIAPQYEVDKVNWVGLVFGLPNVTKFELGGDQAVCAFLGAASPERGVDNYWPALTELHLCLAIFRMELAFCMRPLCERLWPRDGSPEPGLGVKVYLRLPGRFEPDESQRGVTIPDWFRLDPMYSVLVQLSEEYGGRLQLLGHRCMTCHQAKWVDATYV